MDRQTIIDEIRRAATENGGTPLGVRRLESEAGITLTGLSGRCGMCHGNGVSPRP